MTFYRQLFHLTYLVGTLSLYSSASIAQTINVYSYHLDPPFHLEASSTDLTVEFISRLNQVESEHKFKLIVINRPELNRKLIDQEPYLILWANPIWFKSKDKNVMATNNIFWDADIWVSHQSNPVSYNVPSDLIGRHIGGRYGYFYQGVTQLIKSKKIKATFQRSDMENAKVLLEKKIDAFVMSRSSYLYWKAINQDTSKYSVSISPHDAYQRHVLVSQHNQFLLPMLNKFISELKLDESWNNKMKLLGVDALVEPMELELNELLEY